MKPLLRVAPPLTGRRLAATLVRDSVIDRGKLRQRLAAENITTWRTLGRQPFTCCVCGGRGRPYFDFPDLALRRSHGIGVLRESLFCRSCGASMRQRTLALALLSVLPTRAAAVSDITAQDLAGMRVLDTDDHSPIAAILGGFAGYQRSTFAPGVANGARVATGAICADLEDLPFADGNFDVILTSDVMEHVRCDELAHSEILRCLRPGGAYVFTVPYNRALTQTRILVDASRKRDVYLEEPHFHGDPIRGGILSYRIYGRDLLASLMSLGFVVDDRTVDEPEAGIFGGDVLVARKATV